MKISKVISSMVFSSVVMSTPFLVTTASADTSDLELNTSVSLALKPGNLGVHLESRGEQAPIEVSEGKEIAPFLLNDLLVVTDHSGGEGWKLLVKASNFAETRDYLTTSLRLSDEDGLSAGGNFLPLSNVDLEVSRGPSRITPFVYYGTVSAKWGSVPVKEDEISQELEWTLVPITSDPDQG